MPVALDIQHLEKTYRNGFQALKGISMQVNTGDFFALLGPNGAGKSTTIGILTSLIRKTAGTIKIFEHDFDQDRAKAKTCLGVVPQEFNFNIFEKPFDILINQAGYYGIPRSHATKQAEKYLKRLDLWDKRDEPARHLSGGMKRRLLVARALLHEPKLLILDEPTAGVDVETRRTMWRFLKEINNNGVTVILTTHYLEEAENLCNRIAIINQGAIIRQTTLSELMQQSHQETLILNLSAALETTPQLNNLTCRLIEPTVLEVDITDKQPLHYVFSKLNEQNIDVISLRNKSNRLETLFLDLVQKSE